jgi:rhomboid family protein
MFLPIGDDVKARGLPLMGVILIAANIMVWVHTSTLARQAEEAMRAQHFGEGDIIGTDFSGQPIFATRDGLVQKMMHGKRWERFIRDWGLVPSEVAHGDVHGVMSYMFLHANVWHLLGNMLLFLIFARALEAGLGPWLMVLFYVFWGTVAGLFQVLLSGGSAVPYIGADGAVAGIIGAYLCCFGILSRVKVLFYVGFGVNSRVLEIPTSFFVGLWVLLQVWTWAVAGKWGVSNIGWLAHLGGFGVGILTMAVFRKEVQAKLRGIPVQLQVPRKSAAALSLPSLCLDVAAPDTIPAFNVTTAPAVDLPPPVLCSQCREPLTSDHRLTEELYRCPKCTMLTDAAQPVLPRMRR